MFYLALVRSHFGYATQIWTPQSIELINHLERTQRRATRYSRCGDAVLIYSLYPRRTVDIGRSPNMLLARIP